MSRMWERQHIIFLEGLCEENVSESIGVENLPNGHIRYEARLDMENGRPVSCQFTNPIFIPNLNWDEEKEEWTGVPMPLGIDMEHLGNVLTGVLNNTVMRVAKEQ